MPKQNGPPSVFCTRGVFGVGSKFVRATETLRPDCLASGCLWTGTCFGNLREGGCPLPFFECNQKLWFTEACLISDCFAKVKDLRGPGVWCSICEVALFFFGGGGGPGNVPGRSAIMSLFPTTVLEFALALPDRKAFANFVT